MRLADNIFTSIKYKKMSALVQSGSLLSAEEAIPQLEKFGLTGTTAILERRKVRYVPIGSSGSAGVGGGNTQQTFVLPASGGLYDLCSAKYTYTLQVSGSAVPDDGCPFSSFQVQLGSQMLDTIQQASKVSNIEMKLGCSKNYLQTAGSFAGYQLLSNDCCTTLPVAGGSSVIASDTAYGYVANNIADISLAVSRSATASTGGIAGQNRSLPLGLVSGVFRAEQYLWSGLGDLSVNLTTLSASDYLVNPGASTGDYSIVNPSIEIDVLIPSSEYLALLQRQAGSEEGLSLAFESTVMASGGSVPASTTTVQSTLSVSKNCTSLVRAHTVFVPTTADGSIRCNGQSAFAKSGASSYAYRVGTQSFPQIPAQGSASMFMTSISAYGAPLNETGSCINVALWNQSTNWSVANSPGSYESWTTDGGTAKFAMGDSFIPSVGFRRIAGGAKALDIDGISTSAGGNNQVNLEIQMAPFTSSVRSYMELVSVRVIRMVSGSLFVLGS